MDLDVHLTAIAAGDADAFSRWIAGSEMRIRLSLSRFAAQVDVEAVVQETLLRIWQVAQRVEPDGRPNSLLRFAIRVARNTAVSELRRMRAAPLDSHELSFAPEAGDPIEPDPLLRRAIYQCREDLPRRPAEALAARLCDGGQRSDRELAAELHMTLNTFLQNVTRARKLIAACLENKGVALWEVMQ